MDELETRIAADLQNAAAGVGADDGLQPRVRRAVRRRQTRTATAFTLPLVALLAGGAWLLNQQSEDASEIDVITEDPDPDPPIEGPGEVDDVDDSDDPETTDPPIDRLQAALLALGAAIDTAPEGTTTLDGAFWCGVVEHGTEPEQPPRGNNAASCMQVMTGSPREESVMVQSTTTLEGDPVIEVIRATTVDEPATVWVDSTQDAFGVPGWTGLTCRLVFGDDEGDTVEFADCAEIMPAITASPVAVAASGSTTFVVDREWPYGRDRIEVYLVEPFDGSLPTRWTFAGFARPSGSGTAIELSVPLDLAMISTTEFGVMEFTPMIPGTYEVHLPSGFGGEPLATVEVTAGDGEREAPLDVDFAINPAQAVLRDGGIGGVDFGTEADAAIEALVPILGDLAERVPPFEGCLTTGYATFQSGVVIEFWTSADTGVEEFVAWYYGGDNPFTGDRLPRAQLPSGYVPVTADGLGLGASIGEILSSGGQFSGGYDTSWGAPYWFTSEHIAGLLTTDATDPSAKVISITGGRDRAPARTVC